MRDACAERVVQGLLPGGLCVRACALGRSFRLDGPSNGRCRVQGFKGRKGWKGLKRRVVVWRMFVFRRRDANRSTLRMRKERYEVKGYSEEGRREGGRERGKGR